MTTRINLTCNDGVELNATIFDPALDQTPNASLIIAPALGVPQRFYTAFAHFCSDQGIRTLVFDYRGTDDTPQKTVKARFRLAEWGKLDLAAAISYCQQWQQPIHLVGHSVGGQIVGLADNCTQLKSIHLIAASAPYWKRWSTPNNLIMLFSSFILFPAITKLSNNFNTKRYGLGSQFIQSSIISDWASWMRQPDYLFGSSFELDIQAYQSITSPIYSYAISDDKLAPLQNIKHLNSAFSKADVRLIEVSTADVDAESIGHTGLFRQKIGQRYWPKITNAILNG